jgi:bacterioferritin
VRVDIDHLDAGEHVICVSRSSGHLLLDPPSKLLRCGAPGDRHRWRRNVAATVAVDARRVVTVGCRTRGKVGSASLGVSVADLDAKTIVDVLNEILEEELAGVVRYTHYSFLVFGHTRIPIVSWLREQAAESLLHAQQAGEWITSLGSYPSLRIGPLLDSHTFDVDTIMRESLQAEAKTLALYVRLKGLVEGRSVPLEEYARQMIYAEEIHAAEVDKMLRRPGELTATERPPG